MAKLGRRGVSDRLWETWGSGKSFSETFRRSVIRPSGSIFSVIKQAGGYVPPSGGVGRDRWP
jgi:hypothetical protein